MKRSITLTLATLSLAAAAHAGEYDVPAAPAKAATATADSAHSQLLQKHLSAFLRNDLDAVVADYTDDAVLVAPGGTYDGPAQIRQFFEELMKQFPKGASSLALDKSSFHGDMIYFTWHGKTPTLEVPFATDTMIVRGGKIVKQTFAGMLLPARH